MEAINIKATKIIPAINFNADTGILEFRGKSVPNDAIAFYEPLLEWLNEYSKNPHKHTIVNFRLVYFNTNSSKTIMDFFRRIEKMYLDGYDVIVNWYYDTDYEDMKESGEDFASLLKLPFMLIPYSD